jgi:4-hydroxymandelate oxidase
LVPAFVAWKGAGVAVDIAGLERRARALLSGDIYDYYAGGAGREQTLRASVNAWRQFWLWPHVLRDVSAVDTSLRLPGWPDIRLGTPVAVAPAAFQGLAHPAGEVATARGAAQAGALFVLSSRSSKRIEEVGEAVAAAGGTWWYQVYIARDRDITAGLVRRAEAAGARALVLTGDTPVVGRKRRERTEVIPDDHYTANTGQLADPGASTQARDLTPADIGWLGGLAGLPVIVKGVLRADDARACVTAGAAGVVVSNHGGRQLDRAVPSALALPAVAAALGRPGSPSAAGPSPVPGQVYVDGGVRAGVDALVALALGAQVVFLGRPVLWALTCGGEDGVRELLTGLTDELAHAMALAGAASLADVPGLALAGPAGPGTVA